MPTRETLLALRERVLAATGADREMDARIHHALFPDQPVMLDPGVVFGRGEKRPPTYGTLKDYPIDDWDDYAGVALEFRAGFYSASVDAALTLVERVVPGWCPELTRKRSADPEHWGCKLSDQWASYATPKFSGHGPTAPLAILAALLTALASQEATHG